MGMGIRKPMNSMKLFVKFSVHVYPLERGSNLKLSAGYQRSHDSNKRLGTPPQPVVYVSL
jgi:hypothetical protein